jgi:DNA polymerase III subunit gamma/tau
MLSPTWSGPDGSSHNDFRVGSSGSYYMHLSTALLSGSNSAQDICAGSPYLIGLMSESDTPAITTRDPDMPEDALGLGLGLDEPQQPKVETGAAYRVLARKYRPQTFGELIGQDAMVQTLGNAIKRGRLAHAFLMTGVRGVGKTSTARLIAKALNCVGPDGAGGPTIDPCGVCEPCRAIAEGRHIDVIEMDAASHTGVDDVREIIEAVRYSAVSARYKIYIIDEVHMLSKNAFNALLKTLEEPPAHVKFLFATTEVNKLPITVLSRCQRFDLKRIPAELLAAHFAEVCNKEGVAADMDALALIAQAAEGSARDGLSILDQAIAHADMEGADGQPAAVSAEKVRDMLGLSDRGAMRRLLALLLGGDVPAMLAAFEAQYRLGVEPLSVIDGLMQLTHALTLVKSGSPPDPALAAETRAEEEAMAARMTLPNLHRLWQLLLKGHDEVRRGTMPMQSAQMALLRIMHAATLPDPGELARMIQQGGGVGASQAASAPAPSDAPTAQVPQKPTHAALPATFQGLIDLIAAKGAGDYALFELELTLRDRVRVVEYAAPRLIYDMNGEEPQDFAFTLARHLHQWTGQDWAIERGDGTGLLSISEAESAQTHAAEEARRNAPMVRAVMAAFPDAEILPADVVTPLRKANP